jgi:hypothetical protein
MGQPADTEAMMANFLSNYGIALFLLLVVLLAVAAWGPPSRDDS